MTAPLVSVIVPHYNDLHSLDLCLAALSRQTLPPSAYEVIVADNMSSDGENVVKSVIAGRARLVCALERGAGPARNEGANFASGEILAFTDADCIPDGDWLAEGVKALEKIDFVGGAMRVSVTGDGPLTGAQAFELVFAFNNRDYVERKGFTVTANLFCTKTIFVHVGPFKSNVSEDLDWCRRARGLGYHLGYAPAAAVSHPARPNWPELLTKWKRIQSESFALAVTEAGGKWLWLLRSWGLPFSIVLHAARIVASPLLATPSERFGAIVTLVRLRMWRLVDAHRLFFKGH